MSTVTYTVCARATINGTPYAWASDSVYRSSTWHDPILVDFPTPGEAMRDAWGLSEIQGTSLTLADPDNALQGLDDYLDGVDVTLELITAFSEAQSAASIWDSGTSTWDGGASVWDTTSSSEDVVTRILTVDSWRHREHALELELVDAEVTALEQTYPIHQYYVEDASFDELFVDDSGRCVPVATGIAIKVLCALIDTGAGSGPWVYSVVEIPDHPTETVTILTVYRGGRIVNSGDYTTSTRTVTSRATGPGAHAEYTVCTISFASEPKDFSGGWYTIEADVQSSRSNNAATELSRIMAAAGLTLDATSLSGAQSVATAASMSVDALYGRNADGRTYRAIIDDLLLLLRGNLYRSADGEWELVQDIAGASGLTVDEDAGDLVEVSEYARERRPATIELAYRPNPREPDSMQYTVTRTVGGNAGVERYENAYIRDHTTADKLICYLALRRQYNRTARASIYADTLDLGDIVTIDSDRHWSGSRDWIVTRVTREPDCNDLDLLEYASAVYTYSAGTLPAGGETDYSPDYSATPPDAPTGLSIDSSGAVVSEDGYVTSWAEVSCTPPSVNWAQIWFAASNDATGEVYLQVGSDIGGGDYGSVITGMRPGEAHTIIAWAVNQWGVEGTATAGSAHTSATDSGVPSAPTISVAQGVGKLVRVTITYTKPADFKYFEVQRKTGAGGSYATVTTQTGQTYDDTSVAYGSVYYYKVRAEDRSGNQSSYSTEQSVSVSANIGNTDITTGGVYTANLAAEAATQVKESAYIYDRPISTSTTTIRTASITTTGGNVLIVCSCSLTLTTGGTGVSNPNATFSVYRGATPVRSTAAFVAEWTSTAGVTVVRQISFAILDPTPSAGTYTYYFYGIQNGGVGSTGSVTAYYPTIQVMELKR